MTPPPSSSDPLPGCRSAGAPAWVHRLYGVLWLGILALTGYFYLQCVDTQQLGFTHDDGVYAVTGKALATGQGFKLLHVVGQPAEIKYPFAYPALLSLVWRVNPHFPQNLPALNQFTIGFSLAGLGLLALYLRRFHGFPGWLALLVIPLCASNFFFIYFFSSVMSEGPYLFFSLLTLWCFQRMAEKHPARLPISAIGWLVLLSALTALTRVTGVTLMAAIGGWLLLNRQPKNALLYGAGAFLTGVLPWLLWVKLHTPAVNTLNFPLVNAYSNYVLEFASNYTGGNYLHELRTDFLSLISKLLETMIMLPPNFIRLYPQFKSNAQIVFTAGLVSFLMAYALLGYYVLQVVHAVRKSVQGWRLRAQAFSVPGLYLFFYVVLITLWNYEDQMARFLTVVTPLLWLYFFKPWASLLPELGVPRPAGVARWKSALALVLTALVMTLTLWPAGSTYRTASRSRREHWVEAGKYRWLWKDYQDTFAWINRQLPDRAPLAAASDVVFYLYTDHPTFYLFYASLHFRRGKILPASFPWLMKSLDHYGVRYLVLEPHMQARTVRHPANKVAKALMDEFPERFQRLYDSPHGAVHVYRILPPVQTAP